MIHSTYEGLSKTFQTELLMKCVHVIAIGSYALFMQWAQHFWHFLKLCVGRSVVVPKFQKYPRTNALLAVILFLETRRSHKCPNEAIKEDGESQT